MRFRNLKKQSKKPFQKQMQEDIVYASYTDRVKALITDLFMIYIPILYIITYGVMDGADSFKESDIAPLIGVLLYATIYAILTSTLGQTPGKKAYQIMIVDDEKYHKIVTLRAFFRFFVFLLSATTIIGLLLPLIRKDRKSLHDILSKTVVLVLKENSEEKI